MKHSPLIPTLLACVALVGCGSDDQVDLGKSQKLGASLSDYAGNWTGYAEAYEFDDGTDTVRLSLDESGNGVLQFGDTVKLPPPEADKGYPPSVTDPFGGRIVSTGFTYAVAGASVESRRIQLATNSSELYREWCSLLPPIEQAQKPGDEPVYACIGSEDFSMDVSNCKMGGAPVECGRLSCTGVCACDADACAVAEVEDDIELDGALQEQGEELAGTLVLQGQRINVRMTRD